ncbi:hypothetical protein MCERE10_03911 [Burkholderiaceae bacterium]
MRYLTTFACSVLLALFGYIGIIPVLGPTPVTAEYWVQELLVIKRDIIKRYANDRKIIIVSGSSTLFSIDAKLLSEQLGLPVINFGLMGGMPLDRILEETDAASSRNDIVVLPLEPDYYCREEINGFKEWELRNAIAWDHVYWSRLSLYDQLTAIRYLGFKFPLEMLMALFDTVFRPAITQPRLFTLNDAAVLDKFAKPPPLADNLYSVYSMSPFGDIRNTTDSDYTAEPRRADQPIKICAHTLERLKIFTSQQKAKGVSVFFANTPYVAIEGLDSAAVNQASKQFSSTLSTVAPVLDDRSTLIFNREFFLNSALHLNAHGRELRTRQLLAKLRAVIAQQ